MLSIYLIAFFFYTSMKKLNGIFCTWNVKKEKKCDKEQNNGTLQLRFYAMQCFCHCDTENTLWILKEIGIISVYLSYYEKGDNDNDDDGAFFAAKLLIICMHLYVLFWDRKAYSHRIKGTKFKKTGVASEYFVGFP